MRIHKDGFIQCKTLEVKLSAATTRRAMQCSPYLLGGIEDEIEKALGIELEGVERFLLERNMEDDSVRIKIISNWVQPTRT